MSDQILISVCLSLALIAALMAGVFQSFSDFVMRGLFSTPTDGGLVSMQRINVTVMRSWFLASFVVLVPVSIGLALYALTMTQGAAALAIVLAGVIYIAGCFGVTMLGNVPMNNRLAALTPGLASSDAYWQHYAQVWTRFNHARMAACIAVAGCYLYAAVKLAGQGASI